MVELFDIFVQLLFQNFLFTQNEDEKLQMHNFIDQIILKKNAIVYQAG